MVSKEKESLKTKDYFETKFTNIECNKSFTSIMDAPKNGCQVVLKEEGSLNEKDCFEIDTKVGLSSNSTHMNKSPISTLKPIPLIPSLDFLKKKEKNHKVKLQQEKNDNLQDNKQKVDSHQIATKNHMKEMNMFEEKNIEKVLAMKKLDKVTSKIEVATKRARVKSMEELSDVENHTIQSEKNNEPSTKKNRLITNIEIAARLIQSIYKDYVVQQCQTLKHLHEIAHVKSILKDYQTFITNKSSFLEKCKNSKEQIKIYEGIMNLLLQFDVIQVK